MGRPYACQRGRGACPQASPWSCLAAMPSSSAARAHGFTAAPLRPAPESCRRGTARPPRRLRRPRKSEAPLARDLDALAAHRGHSSLSAMPEVRMIDAEAVFAAVSPAEAVERTRDGVPPPSRRRMGHAGEDLRGRASPRRLPGDAGARRRGRDPQVGHLVPGATLPAASPSSPARSLSRAPRPASCWRSSTAGRHLASHRRCGGGLGPGAGSRRRRVRRRSSGAA